jgi:hypothetical protein
LNWSISYFALPTGQLTTIALGATMVLLGSSTPNAPVTYHSTDNGVTWTQGTLPSATPGNQWVSAAYNGSVLFAPSFSNGIVSAVSADGITWAGYPINSAQWSACCLSGSEPTGYYVDYTETDLLLIGTITNLTYN